MNDNPREKREKLPYRGARGGGFCQTTCNPFNTESGEKKKEKHEETKTKTEKIARKNGILNPDLSGGVTQARSDWRRSREKFFEGCPSAGEGRERDKENAGSACKGSEHPPSQEKDSADNGVTTEKNSQRGATARRTRARSEILPTSRSASPEH